jgi:hypothetical protein
MNKHLENMFGKSQAGVSMIVKRTSDTELVKIQRSMRFDTNQLLFIKLKKSYQMIILLPVDMSKKFTLAGGQ